MCSNPLNSCVQLINDVFMEEDAVSTAVHMGRRSFKRGISKLRWRANLKSIIDTNSSLEMYNSFNTSFLLDLDTDFEETKGD